MFHVKHLLLGIYMRSLPCDFAQGRQEAFSTPPSGRQSMIFCYEQGYVFELLL